MGNKAKAATVALTLAAGLVMQFEGRHLRAYLDPPGIPTICWGHTSGVKMGDRVTKPECAQYLAEDLAVAQKAVARLVRVPLPPETRAAVIDFVYNVGATKVAKSTLLRKLNAGDLRGACNQLPRWVYAGGVKLNGLVNRRDAERTLCLEGLE